VKESEEPERGENEEQAMPKLWLLIKRPQRAHTCIPVIGEDTALIGNCISVLVDHLGLPRLSHLRKVLTYSLISLYFCHDIAFYPYLFLSLLRPLN